MTAASSEPVESNAGGMDGTCLVEASFWPPSSSQSIWWFWPSSLSALFIRLSAIDLPRRINVDILHYFYLDTSRITVDIYSFFGSISNLHMFFSPFMYFKYVYKSLEVKVFIPLLSRLRVNVDFGFMYKKLVIRSSYLLGWLQCVPKDISSKVIITVHNFP